MFRRQGIKVVYQYVLVGEPDEAVGNFHVDM
jgi:hypothetical protein